MVPSRFFFFLECMVTAFCSVCSVISFGFGHRFTDFIPTKLHRIILYHLGSKGLHIGQPNELFWFIHDQHVCTQLLSDVITENTRKVSSLSVYRYLFVIRPTLNFLQRTLRLRKTFLHWQLFIQQADTKQVQTVDNYSEFTAILPNKITIRNKEQGSLQFAIQFPLYSNSCLFLHSALSSYLRSLS